MWRWLLVVAFSLLSACRDVQPDVSAFTILNLLVQMEGNRAATQTAFGSLYEDVQPLSRDARESAAHAFGFTLSRSGSRKATVTCRQWDAPLNKLGLQYPGPFKIDLWRPFAGDIRVMCFFNYFDFRSPVESFALQARMWAETNIGPLQSNSHAQQPTSWKARSENTHFPALHIHAPRWKWWQKPTARLILVIDV